MVGGKHAKKFSIVSAWKSCQFLVYFYFTHFFYLKFFSRWQPSNCWVLCQSIKSYKFRLHASVNVHCILQKPSSYLASHSVTALQYSKRMRVINLIGVDVWVYSDESNIYTHTLICIAYIPLVTHTYVCTCRYIKHISTQ